MATRLCPRGDGNCYVPDPAVVLSGGTASVVRRTLLDRIFPAGIDTFTAYTPLPLDLVEQLEASVTQQLAEAALTSLSGDHPTTNQEASLPSELSDIEAAIVVTCDCGHIWIAEP